MRSISFCLLHIAVCNNDGKIGNVCGSWLIFHKNNKMKMCKLLSFAQLSVREIQHNGEDIITVQSLFKLEAGLPFRKDYGSNNMRLDHLHPLVPTSKDYTV